MLAEAAAAEGWTAIAIAMIAAFTAVTTAVVNVTANRRVQRNLNRNGGTTDTVGDATVRLEAGQEHLERGLSHLRTLIGQIADDLRQSVTRDDGRFGRVERDAAMDRDEIAKLRERLGRLERERGSTPPGAT